jgi:hypothetical protein
MLKKIGVFSICMIWLTSVSAQTDNEKVIIMQQNDSTKTDTTAISPDALDRYNEGISAFEQKCIKQL